MCEENGQWETTSVYEGKGVTWVISYNSTNSPDHRTSARRARHLTA